MNDNDLEQKRWHQRTSIRILALLLLPLIAGGLYFISTGIILNRPTPVPTNPDNSTFDPQVNP